MIGNIVNSKLNFKKGTPEWNNHFGFPLTCFVLSGCLMIFFIAGYYSQITLILSLILAALGCISYRTQLIKLEFSQTEKFGNNYNSIKDLLLANDWIVNGNINKTIIQATSKTNNIKSGLLTFIIENEKVSVNVINHPNDQSLIRSLLIKNNKSYKFIKS